MMTRSVQRGLVIAIVTLLLASVSKAWAQQEEIIGEQPKPGSEKSAESQLEKGVEALQAGRAEEAVKLLDRAAEARPEVMPYLWQRGIAQYFAGRYAEGRRQFEAHRKVNPHDVENAAWHFLCVAATDGVDEAREAMLPAPGDPRVPMREIYALYAGTGEQAAVNAAVEKLPADSQARRTARFYADLYIGLLAHAEGDTEQAEQYLNAAAEVTQDGVMVDVARVARDRLASETKASSTR